MSTRVFCCWLSLLFLAARLGATWSIVVVNLKTGEVAVGTATCVTNSDLRASVPLIVPEYGAAAHQSSVDVTGVNRMLNRELLLQGVPVAEILQAIKDQDSLRNFRQIGIVSLRGDAVSFTGVRAMAWAGGVTGQAGDLVYAIQGNVLTGQPVVDAAEQALIATPGSLADKLMAAMEAAARYGGDGRCSCSIGNPTSCGSPPPSFTKSAHIGTMLVARPGDPLDVCNAGGCARGDYYLALNVPFQFIPDPDPVLQLRQLYDQWKLGLHGRPDAYRSSQRLSQGVVSAGAAAPLQVEIELVDFERVPLAGGGASVGLEHDPRSAGGAVLLQVHDHGDGSYTLDVQPGTEPGVDLLRVVVDDGVHPVTLWPPLELVVAAPQSAPWNDPRPVAGLEGPVHDAVILDGGLVAWLLLGDAAGGRGLARCERPDLVSPFGLRQAVAIENAAGFELRSISVSPDEGELLAGAVAPGEIVERLYRASRAGAGAPFGPLKVVAELDSNRGEGGPALSPDGRELVFESARGASGDLWRSWRHAEGNRWMPPLPLAVLNAGGEESGAAWLPGATGLRFLRDGRPFQAPRIPGGLLPPAPEPGSWAVLGRGAAAAAQVEDELWLSGYALGGVAALPAAAAALAAGPAQLSAAAGGRIDFTLDAGPDHGGAAYFLLGGAPGSTSGAGTLVAPFVADAATLFCWLRANGPYLPGFQGVLDAQGRAAAALLLPPGALTDPLLLDRAYDFSFFTSDGFVSNAARVEVVP